MDGLSRFLVPGQMELAPKKDKLEINLEEQHPLMTDSVGGVSLNPREYNCNLKHIA